MFSLFRSLRRPSARRSRQRHSQAEQLDQRLMLTAPTVAIDFLEAQGPGTTVEVRGTVSDDVDPQGLTVTISGIIGGTTTVDAGGRFTFAANATGPGTVVVSVTDATNQTGTDELEFSDSPPGFMMFDVYAVDGNLWEANGMIMDEYAGGLTVTLGGILPPGLTAAVLSDMTFSVRFTWSNPTTGQATAELDDWWGQTGTAEAFVFV